jgi:hypothetical protein
MLSPNSAVLIMTIRRPVQMRVQYGESFVQTVMEMKAELDAEYSAVKGTSPRSNGYETSCNTGSIIK